MTLYTVGHEVNYDTGLLSYGLGFMKAGASSGYAGGTVFQNQADADQVLKENPDFALYEIDADWDRDTELTVEGRRLVRDSVILRKVPRSYS